VAALLLAAAFAGWTPIRAAQPAPRIPTFGKVRQAVMTHFQALPDFQPGGIITRTDAQPVFDRLKQMGWAVADRDAILAALPTDGEFLVEQLRTPAGKKFAPQIAVYPQGYDRLDRLSRLPLGKNTVRDLIRGTGGEQLIEYMTTSSGGSELGKMLSKDPNGKKFNQPTGRIYTMEMLLVRLQQSHTAATRPANSK
jgi:hypothetical protein